MIHITMTSLIHISMTDTAVILKAPTVLSTILLLLSSPQLVNELHIIGRKHSPRSIRSHAQPPARVYLLNLGDQITGVKGDLIVLSWKRTKQ